jgi:replicative DNA helicase
VENKITAEQLVIGAIIYNGNRVVSECVRAGVQPDWFQTACNRQVYEVALNMFVANRPVAIETVSAKLLGIAPYLDKCVDQCATPSMFPEYIALLKSEYLFRRIKAQNENMTERLSSSTPDDAEQLLADAQSQWLNLSQEISTETVLTDEEICKSIADRWEARGEVVGGTIGWGMPQLDEGLGKLSDELIFIAARESVGKTAFVLQMLAHLWKSGIPVSLASLESKRAKIYPRLVAHLAQLDTYNLNQGKATLVEIEKGKAALATIRGWKGKRIFDCGMSMNQIRAWAFAEKSAGSRLLVVDNFKHIRPDRKFSSPVEQFREHSMQLKWLRDDVGLPLIVLHHLNKEMDLSWSDDLRRDADIILILTENENFSRPPDPLNGDWVGYWVIEFTTAKHRDGKKGLKLNLEFDKKFQTFKKWEV